MYRGKVSGIMEFGCFVELQGFSHLGKKVWCQSRRSTCHIQTHSLFVYAGEGSPTSLVTHSPTHSHSEAHEHWVTFRLHTGVAAGRAWLVEH